MASYKRRDASIERTLHVTGGSPPPVVILAARTGSRLAARFAAIPKLLLSVGGVSLAERCVRTFRAAGIDELVVVLGHEARRVQLHFGEVFAALLRPSMVGKVVTDPPAEGEVVMAIARPLCFGRLNRRRARRFMSFRAVSRAACMRDGCASWMSPGSHGWMSTRPAHSPRRRGGYERRCCDSTRCVILVDKPRACWSGWAHG